MGTHLVERLLEDGHAVRIYDRSPNRFQSVPCGASYSEGELGNHGLIREALEDVEVGFHLASTALPKTSNDGPVYDACSNLVDAIQLLETCVETRVRKVLFASSNGTVYGIPESVPISGDHLTHPITSHGVVKLAKEKYLNLFHLLYGLDYAVRPISNLYGPLQNPEGRQGAVGIFLRHLHLGRKITVWGDGSVVRDYIYVSDLVEAFARTVESTELGSVLNVGSGRGVSINELLDTIIAVVGESPMVEYQPSRRLDVPENVLDISLASQALGWRPQTDLADGISRTWNWIQKLSDNRAGF